VTPGSFPGRPSSWDDVRHVVLLCDNASSVANLRSGFGGKLAANELMFDLFSHLYERGVDLSVEHVPGDFNPSDDPSRLAVCRGQPGRPHVLRQCEREYGTRLNWSSPESVSGVDDVGEWRLPFLEATLHRVKSFGDPTAVNVGDERRRKRPCVPATVGVQQR